MMSDRNPQGIKILVSDFKLAHKNYKTAEQNRFKEEIKKYALKRTEKSIYNMFGLLKIPTFEEAKTDLYNCIDNDKGFRNMREEWDITWYAPPYNNIDDSIQMTTIIQDKFMWVDIHAAEFTARYKDK